MKRSKKYTLWAIVLFLIIAHSAFSQSKWRINNRFQVLFEHDNNVEESIRDAREAQSVRFLVQARATRIDHRSQTHLSYQGGLQIYNNFSIENKLINEGQINYFFNVLPRLKLGVRAFGRLKLFLNRDTDYALGYVSPFLQMQLLKNLTMQTGVRQENLDYAKSVYYDYKSPSVFVEMTKRFSHRISISPFFSYAVYRYDRPVFKLFPTFPEANAPQQRDHANLFSLRAGWLWKGWLLNLSANHERYHSNSYGYEYRKQYLTILVAKNFYGFLIRGVGEWQKKKYLDELLPAWPLELDTEREQSNFLVLDLSRDVTSSLTCVIRFAWYENESPWASFYYNKRLVNAGVEFRLPVK
ncbi:MAG: hypothetical protein GWP06_01070 [Actinobacteria bacterium]|nr:hypothetical protein [Actinomycetota bacterium]